MNSTMTAQPCVCILWLGGVSCPVSVYCDGMGCHVLCLYTVTGWGVMSCVCILWRGGVSCPVSVYCDGVGCHVLCLRHGISVWQHIGQSTTATSRHCRDMTSDVSKWCQIQINKQIYTHAHIYLRYLIWSWRGSCAWCFCIWTARTLACWRTHQLWSVSLYHQSPHHSRWF